MSWYAEIHGEIATSPKAYPMVVQGLRPWLKPSGAGGLVEVSQENGQLVIVLGNVYRELGRRMAAVVWRIARKFPKETSGMFSLISTDGCFFAAEYRVEGGRVYRRALAEKEEEWRPAGPKAARKARS